MVQGRVLMCAVVMGLVVSIATGLAPSSRIVLNWDRKRAQTGARRGSGRVVTLASHEDASRGEGRSKLAPLLVPALAMGGVAAAGYCIADPQGIIETARHIDLKEALDALSGMVESLGPLGFVYFSAAYIFLEILALPAFPLTASAGYLFGTLPGTATVLFSATVAAGISFLIGRTFLRGYIESVAEDNATFQAIDKAVGREGFKVVLLLRLSPLLPFALSNYLYGLTSVDFYEYLGATALGFAPGTLAYVYSGDAMKVLSADDAGQGALPWYAYAAVLAFVAAFSKVASDIASDALASIDEEET